MSFALSLDWVGTATHLRPSVRQQVPAQEVTTDSYFSMMRHMMEERIVNVESVRFARDRYTREVEGLLALTEET